jgi:multiple sugar transport system permease protein
MSTAVQPVRKRLRRRPSFGRFVFLGLYLLFVLTPLYWVLITSIKPSNDYLAVPPVWFPSEPTFIHYTVSLFAYRGLKGLTNSLIISLSATVLSALLGTFMAYSLARFNTGGKHLSFWVLSQRFLPPVAIVLPVFLIYRNTGLHDTHVGLIIAYTVFTLPVSVWMMYAYFRQLPRSMEDAALVDGCTRWQAFWQVEFPLAGPGIASAGIFAFLTSWNEFALASQLTRSINSKTLPVGLLDYTAEFTIDWRGMCALAVVMIIPALTLTFIVQKHLVSGLTSGAVKG